LSFKFACSQGGLKIREFVDWQPKATNDTTISLLKQRQMTLSLGTPTDTRCPAHHHLPHPPAKLRTSLPVC
jgi:hypothetical protein